MTQLEKIIRNLPEDAKKELFDFAEFLNAKYQSKSFKKMKLNWAGSLEKYREELEPVELQHSIINEWGKNVSD